MTTAVKDELRFTVRESDTVTDDMLGEASWKVADGTVKGHELSIHGGTGSPPATGTLTIDVTLLPFPQSITFCIQNATLTNTESTLLNDAKTTLLFEYM